MKPVDAAEGLLQLFPGAPTTENHRIAQVATELAQDIEQCGAHTYFLRTGIHALKARRLERFEVEDQQTVSVIRGADRNETSATVRLEPFRC